jgi:CelD/BcsL family acetyltransferase involved in cellulose biosynthesis
MPERAELLHAKIEKDAAFVAVEKEEGAAPALDRVAASANGAHSFLRAAWFRAAARAPLATLVARRAGGEPIAAIPLVSRGRGLLRLRQVPGSYWPFRSFPVADDAGDGELCALLASPAAQAALGRIWRLGPIYADDPTGERLARLALASGWTVLKRRLATSYVVDLKRLALDGPWPSTKTLRKNRWCERRLAEMGDLAFSTVSGPAWNAAVLDTLAAIEAESWVGAEADAHDTKFLDPESRRVWERAIEDPALAAMLSCSLLHVGGVPAAFTFSVGSGARRTFIANSYSKRFAGRSPGRILLYRDLQQAAEAGVEAIGWGAGDPGYKTEMGARPGPEILDLLIVRGGALAALARPFWERPG